MSWLSDEARGQNRFTVYFIFVLWFIMTRNITKRLGHKRMSLLYFILLVKCYFFVYTFVFDNCAKIIFLLRYFISWLWGLSDTKCTVINERMLCPGAGHTSPVLVCSLVRSHHHDTSEPRNVIFSQYWYEMHHFVRLRLSPDTSICTFSVFAPP